MQQRVSYLCKQHLIYGYCFFIDTRIVENCALTVQNVNIIHDCFV